MNTELIRPRVADLVFHLYDRPLHPELLESLSTRTIARENFRCVIRIMRTGHAITWEIPRVHITEVTATRDTPLPAQRALIRHRMHGEQTDKRSFPGGLTYQTSFQVESLTPELFRHVHDDILRDGLSRGMLHSFQVQNRLTLSPLGYITSERWAGN